MRKNSVEFALEAVAASSSSHEKWRSVVAQVSSEPLEVVSRIGQVLGLLRHHHFYVPFPLTGLFQVGLRWKHG